ncbi:MAG: tryptophan--tRNA ligase [Nocardioides sp.]
MKVSKRSTILSGVQPSGDLHLGNYLGALKQWAGLSVSNDCYFCIVDLHALTSTDRPDNVRIVDKAREAAALYIACGIDPKSATIFCQSQVPQHTQLMWYLTCYTPVGSLQRMTQYKAKAASKGPVYSGLLTYPVLMAADILLYQADVVPVGDDQKQHIELTRDIAARFNSTFGEVFTIPDVRTPTTGARVMALDNPTEKMSKSTMANRQNHGIGLLDPPEKIRRKLSRAMTDSNSVVDPDVMGPGVSNLLEIYAGLNDIAHEAACKEFTGAEYRFLKEGVADSIVRTLDPIQARYQEVIEDANGLDSVLRNGAAVASERAKATIERAEVALGLR